jgi:hypothetical protein
MSITKLLLKKSSVADKVPSSASLDYGELAINYTDGLLYFKDSSNVIRHFTSESQTLDIVTTNGSTTSNNVQLGGLNIGGYYNFPQEAGTSGQILAADANGDLQWVSPAVNDGVSLTDLSATNVATPAGQGSLSYNNSTGQFSFTPPDLSQFLTEETDPLFQASPAFTITSTHKSNWSAAYSWGDHSQAGYLTSSSLNGYATETYVNTAISDILDAAPEALNTLNELAAALGDDPDFAATIANSLNDKIDISDFSSILLDNDGVGSGLDADLLDGQEGTYYLNYNNFTNTPSIPTAVSQVTNDLNFISLTDLSVQQNSVQGNGSIGFNNTTGVITYTPPDLSSFISLNSISVVSDPAAGNGSLTYDNTTGVITHTPPDLSGFLTSETLTSLSLSSNILTYTDENGDDTNIDLTLYLDDTNLARLVSGSVDVNGIATFTRDDETTFTVDFSSLFDDTNLSRITSASFTDGNLTLTRDDATEVDVNLDGRYLQSYTETNDLTSAVTWANVPDANITQSSVTQHQAALSITESQISDLQSYLTTETDPTVPSHVKSITTTEKSNWNEAHSWGDHSQAGYLTSETDSQTLSFTSPTLTISNGNSVDLSSLLDDTDTNDFLTNLSFNDQTGVLTATVSNQSDVTVNLDGRYLQSYTETNDLTSAVTWANVPDANITESSVTQHQAALSITESQISDLQSYLTAVSESDVTQHQAALSITESQISDLQNYAVDGSAGTFSSVQLTGGTGDEGTLSWNDSDRTLNLEQGGVTLQLGQETHMMVRNATGSTIGNGTFLGFTGATVGSNRVIVGPFDTSTMDAHMLVGFATEDISNGVNGFATSFGYVRELDTRGTAASNMAVGDEDWSVGDLLYPHPTQAGKLTNVAPTTGFKASVAVITNRHSTQGEIFVRVTALDENAYASAAQGALAETALQQGEDYIDLALGLEGEDVSYSEGRIYYNDEYKALTVYNDIVGSSLQVGHEDWVRVYNNTGSIIANGTPVYVTGAFGENPTVAPADATTELKSYVIGIATNDIATNSVGVATVRGLISGIDTSGITVGDRVHLGASGGYVKDSLTYPYYPVDLGTCVVSDATNGYIYVSLKEHHFESFRVSGNTHLDGNLTVEGNLTVNGTQSIVSQNNLAINDSSVYLNSGDTIGDANTTFSGSGLDDAYFTGHFEGTETKNYYVRIDGVGTGTGGVDTFEWSYDNFSTTEATGVDITGVSQELGENIRIFFNATTGHTSGDSWSGSASPLNVDSGWASNRNTGTTGVGYTHMGVFFDVSDEKFKFYDSYSPEPNGTIDTSDASFNLATISAGAFEGDGSGLTNLSIPAEYLTTSNADSRYVRIEGTYSEKNTTSFGATGYSATNIIDMTGYDVAELLIKTSNSNGVGVLKALVCKDAAGTGWDITIYGEVGTVEPFTLGGTVPNIQITTNPSVQTTYTIDRTLM